MFRVNAYTITLDQNGPLASLEYIDVDDDGTNTDRDFDASPDLYIYSNMSDLIKDADLAGAGQANVSTAEVAEGIEALQFEFGWDVNENGEIEDAEFVDDPSGQRRRGSCRADLSAFSNALARPQLHRPERGIHPRESYRSRLAPMIESTTGNCSSKP